MAVAIFPSPPALPCSIWNCSRRGWNPGQSAQLAIRRRGIGSLDLPRDRCWHGFRRYRLDPRRRGNLRDIRCCRIDLGDAPPRARGRCGSRPDFLLRARCHHLPQEGRYVRPNGSANVWPTSGSYSPAHGDFPLLLPFCLRLSRSFVARSAHVRL